jgi:hypothetical protein
MSLYIGVDSGTQSVKAVALDLETGRVVAEARRPHRLIPGLPPGHMEQHPQEWVLAMDAAIGEVALRIDRSRVRGNRRVRPAARLRPPGRNGRGHPPGKTLVRHQHLGGVRDPDAQAGRERPRSSAGQGFRSFPATPPPRSSG